MRMTEEGTPKTERETCFYIKIKNKKQHSQVSSLPPK